MKKATPLIIVFAFVVSAFYLTRNKKNDPNRYASFGDMLILPFDTAKVLAMMKISDSVNEDAKYLHDPDAGLFPKIDTFDLIDMRWACDCPNWRYADSTTQNFSSKNDFYLEPADNKLKLSEYLCPGQRIQFIGREYGGIGYPKNPQFEDPHPPAGKVFKYYAYKIYKPFRVYGPNVKTNDINEYDMTGLIVK